jgi:hypothetical protein
LQRIHPFGSIGQFQQFLIGSGVLYNQFRLAVDGQHDGMTRFLQLAKEFGGIPLEVR